MIKVCGFALLVCQYYTMCVQERSGGIEGGEHILFDALLPLIVSS